jgi:type I restriction enzyme S subunit
MERYVHGSTMRHVNRKEFLSTKIPLPPLPEQRRIAAILDKADAVRRKRQQTLDLADQFLRSAFLDMFGDPITNPKRWPVKKLGDVGVLDRGRSQHRPRNDAILLGGPYPLIQTGDVANSGGVIQSYTQTYSEVGLKQSRLWKAGTLCITIAANIANTAVLAFDACFPDSVVGFTPGSRVNTEYVQGWFSFLQPMLETRAPQVAQKNINLRILRGLDIPIPPIELQAQYSKALLNVRRQRDLLSGHNTKLDRLASSLVQHAFRGGL